MQRVLVYLLRRDLRLADNPIFHEIARLNSQSQKPFTHVLPVYVFPAAQVEVSGFLTSDGDKSPYPEARSKVGGFWRCGKLRSKFLAESIWDLKTDLERISSGLVIRVGTVRGAVQSILEGFRSQKDAEVHGVWMTSEEGWEEKIEENDVKELMDEEKGEFKLWPDEKYYVDDRDLPIQESEELSDVFTTFRKTVEPLRTAPRKEHPTPGSLPPLPDSIPDQAAPFSIPSTYDGLESALWKPFENDEPPPNAPTHPPGAESAHPFTGGSKAGHERVLDLIESGSMTAYKDTRNGLLGLDFSTKLSAWLALGSISARQVHWKLIDFEDGKTDVGKGVDGYGQGENKGTAGVRFELLWRDYMRLCTRKFGVRLFFVDGYRQDPSAKSKFISSPYTHSTQKKNTQGVDDTSTRITVERFITGRTGTGLIDASQRELFLTGWTSNRSRQNVASYLSKHLGIDWRIGAEWYEMNLIDYDVSSNWGNWQYVAGVGNDPRGDARVFNPVKQAVDYDTNGEYVRTWVPELRDVGRSNTTAAATSAGAADDRAAAKPANDSLESLMGVFQAWRIPAEEKKRLGLEGVEWVEKPLIRIDFSVNRRGGGSRRGNRGGGDGGFRGRGGRGRGRGGRGGGDYGRGPRGSGQ
ncbi:hypothetical protein M409DRAFT_63051 [Zasmidium cellare ATCC 36951]|uniref:Cryptochrome DASH n=1 Tax=Zasmidium cellare ATCC 36951 TaxID=1080233 RepID=A0A6A6CZ19_ZASCE|nr:uncharacterized protein M409DRAFT_63051 [Zasmidium cellare ATCC 36951]KAF2172331.1 hypothetical protein M409DRAFT_63051 [Zasmidium cellare ATCC 36951]